MNPVILSSTSELARAIRAKTISSLEVVDACLAHLDRVQPTINAMVHVAAESARAKAREADASLASGVSWGPLHGVPCTIKDSLDVAGMPSTAGTFGRREFVPTVDATVVARLRNAGAIVLGKSNLSELALGYETDNSLFGRTSNPWDTTRTTGGSSGGEAALVATGISPFGVGTDAGGSVRVPAHFCGVVGFKPTNGRVPCTGMFPPAYGVAGPLWQPGILARAVEDLALVLPIIAGEDGVDASVAPVPLRSVTDVAVSKLRVAFFTDNRLYRPTPETMALVRAAAQCLEQLGAEITESAPPLIEQTTELFFSLLFSDGGENIRGLLTAIGSTRHHWFIDEVFSRATRFGCSGAVLGQRLVQRDQLRAEMLAFMANHDAIICPVVACPAVRHGASWETDDPFSYSALFNITGWPAVSVPCGMSLDGLPIGIQVASRPWREDIVLAIAKQLEAGLGGWKCPPLA